MPSFCRHAWVHRCLLACTVLLHAAPVADAQTDVPTADNFLRRLKHDSVAIGDFVYIDGGELSQNVSGTTDAVVRPNNKTLSIDMRTSWTNDTVSINAIDKGDAPILAFSTLWTDEADSFYLWSGQKVDALAVPSLGLWKFTADGSGGGSWAKEGQSDLSDFNKLTRPAGGYGASLKGVGYYAGGFTSSSTDGTVFTSSQIPVPGIVSYNFSSGDWGNASTADFTRSGTQIWGKAAPVPFGGDGGLLVLMGGEFGTSTGITNNANFLDLDTIYIYDPSNATWYTQPATGDVPGPRDGFCLVGAQGANGTYELFLFGGWNAGDGVTYDDTYVLSLPAFRWFKGPDAGAARLDHTCNVVGSGRRQFIAIGGHNNNLATGLRWATADPWKQGLGIFDMTDMRWSSSYDADAAEYESPQVVQEWYKSGNSTPSWTSDTVKTLFANKTLASLNSDTSGSSTTSTSAANATSKAQSQSSKSSTGAIVGGVVGGVGGLALLGALLLFLRRTQRNRKSHDKVESLHYYPELETRERAELPAHQAKELPADAANVEVDGTQIVAELPGHDIGSPKDETRKSRFSYR